MIVFLCVYLFTNILLGYTITMICPANLDVLLIIDWLLLDQIQMYEPGFNNT